MNRMTYRDYLYTKQFPIYWCAGCGGGLILGGVARAFEELQLDIRKTVAVSGIGCWGMADSFLKVNGLHGTHGRALAYATGIKLANPELTVLAFVGDGDGVTIGGNHFIHAARRNVDITVVMSNNFNYGTTGGQYSATTPENSITPTSRYGHIEQSFDVCDLARASGASYVARSTCDNVMLTKKLVADGIRKKGFSFIEVMSTCPTHYGRNNKMPNALEQMKWLKESSVTAQEAQNLPAEELSKRIVVGKLVDKDSVDYGTKYLQVIERAKAAKEGGK